jgi:LPXTG-motif cell wall-anchored protein
VIVFTSRATDLVTTPTKGGGNVELFSWDSQTDSITAESVSVVDPDFFVGGIAEADIAHDGSGFVFIGPPFALTDTPPATTNSAQVYAGFPAVFTPDPPAPPAPPAAGGAGGGAATGGRPGLAATGLGVGSIAVGALGGIVLLVGAGLVIRRRRRA